MPAIITANPAAGRDYVFDLLPETEAEATDLCAVWEFNGGASANETGVGGGLLGVDLVATQVGSIPAAVNGRRTITDRASQSFLLTADALNAFIANATGFSWLLKLWNINTTGTNSTGPMLYYVYGGGGLLSLNAQRADGYYTQRGSLAAVEAEGVGLLPNLQRIDLVVGTDVPLYQLVSVDPINGLVFSALSKEQQPTKLSDCLVYNISQPHSGFSMPDALAYTYRHVVGCSSTYIANGLEVEVMAWAKYPTVRFI